MKVLSLLLSPLLTTFLLAAPAARPAETRELFGIGLDMPRAEAKKRLEVLGELTGEDRKRQEIWKLRDDASFSHLVVGFDKAETLRYVTAIAREDKEAKRVPYAEIGSLETARQAGDVKINNFNYEWEIPAAGDEPAAVLSARGRDAEFLSTLSLKRLGDSSDKAKEPD